MADIFCPRCGEPWDIDSLHEAYDEDAGEPVPWATAVDRFRRFGCGAMTGAQPTCALDPTSPRARVAKMEMSMSVHPDDWATDLSDAEYLGLDL
jgi:hypothetical protein